MPDSTNNSNNRNRNILIAVGMVLGVFFLYLAFRDISWQDFVHGLKQVKPIYLLPATVLILAIQFVRALRFGVIIRPFCPLRTKVLWDMLNLWGAASMVLPARLSEFVRPYLLQQVGASFSSGLGAVMVERFFDLLSLLLLFGLVLWKTPEAWKYAWLGEALLLGLVAGYAMVLVTLAWREKVQALVDRFLSLFPPRAATFLGGIFHRLLDAFGIMASFKQAMIIFAYSIFIWTLFSFLTYLFLLAFSIEAPFLVAITVQIFVCFAVALPSAPGFVGTFHAACRYALALFGIHAVVAVSFATVYHLFSVFLGLGLGTLSYFTSEFRFDRWVITGQAKTDEADTSLRTVS